MELTFEEKASGYLERCRLEILQVNLGNLCNQACLHCHVGASPRGEKVMDGETVGEVLTFLKENPGLTLDITGGSPELNENFRRLVEEARPLTGTLMVRSNLTVALEPGQEDLIDFFVAHRVKIVSSLPCYTRQNVDAQRGAGVFEKSISVLRRLNRAGYGDSKGLVLDLVYNPGGAFLPGEQKALEGDYKGQLKEDFGVTFDRLITITNAPIGRFGERLKQEDKWEEYTRLLDLNFNSRTLPNIMCRSLVSVDWRGFLHDCDFNQALGLVLRDRFNRPLHIASVLADDLEGRKIITDSHCFSCTAGSGSSCSGALL